MDVIEFKGESSPSELSSVEESSSLLGLLGGFIDFGGITDFLRPFRKGILVKNKILINII